jgi:hypothetical protein
MPALASHPTHFHEQNTQTNPYPSKASASQRYFLTSMKNRCGFKTTNLTRMAKGLSDFDVSYTPEDAQRIQPN